MKVVKYALSIIVAAGLGVLGFANFLGGQQLRQGGQAVAVSLNVDTKASSLFIDRDGDGYGTGCQKGCDADDDDAAVNTSASALAKYHNAAELIARRGYHARRIFFISPDGNDETGEIGNIDRPFQTWNKVEGELRPGDVAVFREAKYRLKYTLGCERLKGEDAAPIVIMAMPGETVTLAAELEGISIKKSSNLVLDGFCITGGSGGYGATIYFSSNIVLRNLDIREFSLGIKAMQDLHNITVENCVIRDNVPSHGIYFGSRDLVNSDIAIRNCLIYGNGRHGIQHNGRVTNLVVENNRIHSNALGGVSCIMGVSDSKIRRNIIFNNKTPGVIFYLYDDSPTSGIVPYDQMGNLVEGNIIWVGRFSSSGDKTPSEHAAIHFNDSTEGQQRNMSAVIRGNILVSYGGPIIKIGQDRFLKNLAIEGNQMYRLTGRDHIMTCGEQTLDWRAFENSSSQIRGNSFGDPKFADVSEGYFSHPEKFNFARK